MGFIGDAASGLERRGASFTVESLAKELRQEWVEDALRLAGRHARATSRCLCGLCVLCGEEVAL